ncbi:hypothetical protein PHLGIDRAFT_127739 [Phlebiopsis gigantea 11061_1 CR5-6]|uniref:Uncharacterized protein n=1 Tax=Phlebiopsis gigantea (strain 11061_1 CR5-6) TaxID=745531 RepID=A0A0C3SAU0_PHLG1|nr:hypothetical protein PHLGIDRAFT_127739 [Phlebiopsis gigantea 11061_1 CR5-6]
MVSASRRRAEKARMPSDSFRPKFPVDPFAAATVREPWFVRPEALPSIAHQARRDVILVLGAPSTSDLTALLNSRHLANSLLILASHNPPPIPHTTLPTVRILRLDNPLAIEHAGAVRFVNVLEWAERVARLWRKYGGYGAVELSEDDDGVEHLTPPSILRFRSSQSTPSSPRSSSTQLSDPRASSAYLEPYGGAGRPRSLSAKILGRARHMTLPAVDPSQRPFDGLVNFLPPDVSDKALLKQAILVTTISRPFVISSRPRLDERRTRKSILSTRSSTSVYLPPTPPYQSGESLPSLSLMPTKAHLIHVLPVETRSVDSFPRSKLVQSLESFLLSFGIPTSLDIHGANDNLSDRLRPYIMPTHSLGITISTRSSAASTSPYGSWPSDCTFAELVLCGSLDGDDVLHGQQPRTHMRTTPRALLSQASDVILLAEDAPTPPAVVVSQSDPGQSSGTFGGGRFARDNSASPAAAPSFAAFRSASLSSGSPLAKSERSSSFGGLPTPPDSEEEGAEACSEDLQYRPRKPLSSASTGRLADVAPAVKQKRARWKFWARPAKVPAR